MEEQEEMEAQGRAQQGVESGEGDPKRMGRVTQSGGEWQAVAERIDEEDEEARSEA